MGTEDTVQADDARPAYLLAPRSDQQDAGFVPMTERKYLPTFSDLVDRMSIVMLKSIFIQEHHEEYVKERSTIEHDIDLLLDEKDYKLTAADIRALMGVMLANHFIWVNESKAREGGSEQDKLLKLTHSINGCRNTAKNKLAVALGQRCDYKIDCFAAELVKEFGNWNVL